MARSLMASQPSVHPRRNSYTLSARNLHRVATRGWHDPVLAMRSCSEARLKFTPHQIFVGCITAACGIILATCVGLSILIVLA